MSDKLAKCYRGLKKLEDKIFKETSTGDLYFVRKLSDDTVDKKKVKDIDEGRNLRDQRRQSP